jgi:hypothetical protein
MYKFFLAMALLLPDVCHAQPNNKFDFGCSVPLYIKYNPVLDEDPLQRMFGATGIDACLKVNGTEDNSMAFIMSLGLLRDTRPFRLDISNKLTVNLYLLNINPTVAIPSRWQHIQYNLGIGTLVRLGQGLIVSTSTDTGPGYHYTSLDSVDKLLTNNSRGVTPYVSLGLTADIGKHFKLQFTLQPTFLNFYEPDTHVQFVISSFSSYASSYFDMSYQPVYIGLKLYYFFHGNV